MDKAKRGVEDFISQSGHHETTTHETVAPTIKKEVVKPTQHEQVSTAVDKEIHQDHYHRVEQPIHDREVLPEQHKTNLGKVVHREFDNRDQAGVERALRTEQAQMRDERVVDETSRTKSHAPVVQGEHVHHHVHETIQPVLHKEVIQPEVVHTTVPIHEVHHNEARIHGTSTLPPISMEQYKKQGGALGGSTERHGAFEGCPKGVTDTSTTSRTGVSSSHTGVSGSSNASTGTSAMHTSGHHSGATGTGTSAMHTSGHHSGATGTTSSTTTSGSGLHTSGVESHHETKKPSLLDKLNPMKDADGDGKKGFMS